MKFEDKLTPTGEIERNALGEETDRFKLVLETRHETASVHAALAGLATIAMESEVTLEKDDTRLVLNYLRANEYGRSRITMSPEQAQRIVWLLRQGAATATVDSIRDQAKAASEYHNEELTITDEQLTQLALEIADGLANEIEARQFRKELVNANFQDFLDSSGES